MSTLSRPGMPALVLRWIKRAFLASILSAFLAFNYQLRQSKKSYDSIHLPGPENHWLFGSALELKNLVQENSSGNDGSDRLAIFQKLKDKYGTYTKFRVFTKVFTLCFNAALFETMAKSPKPELYRRMAILFGDGLVTRNGEDWRKRRTILSPGFAPKMIRSFMPWFLSSSHDLVSVVKDRMCSDHEVDFSDLVKRATFDIITRAGFGYDMDTLHGKNEERAAAFDRILPLLVHPLGNFGGFLGTHLLRLLYFRTYRLVDATICDAIDRRIKGETKSPDGQHDFLDLLLNANAKNQLSRAEICDEVLLFFVAGFDTTALSMQWCLALLAKHPKIWDKVQEEVLRVFPNGEEITFDKIKELEYMQRVFMESLRMYPPTFALTKVAPEDLVTETGHVIPKGADVMFPTAQLHRDPQVWEKPNDFDPDLHFSPEAVASRHPIQYSPFSFGERTCIGRNFFWVEGRIILAELARNFDRVELVNNDVPDFTMSTGTLHPVEHIKLRFFERESA